MNVRESVAIALDALRGATTGLPAWTPWWSVLVAFFFSIAVGLCFGLYPTVRASRLDAVEALRWE